MNRAELQKIVAAARLPEPLKKYIPAYCAGRAGAGFRRLLKADPARLIGSIADVLALAGGILGVPAGEVLFATGFNTGNLAPGRFEAALAELRAVVFLAGADFTAVRLVPQSRSRTADITAARGGNTYAFEVRCLTGAGVSPSASSAEPRGKALCLLEKKYRKKMPQAACSRKKGGLSHCGLIFVINSLNFAPFSASGNLLELAAALYQKVGSPERQHLCLLSGGETGVFPAWEV